jgi:signal transduction histidine kinase
LGTRSEYGGALEVPRSLRRRARHRLGLSRGRPRETLGARTTTVAVEVNQRRMRHRPEPRNVSRMRVGKVGPAHGRRQLSRFVLDVSIALTAGLVTVAGIAARDEVGSLRPDVLGYSLGIGAAAALLWRRRFPSAVVAVVEVINVVYHAIGYPGGPPVVSLWVALFSAAALGRQRAALAGLLSWVAISALGQLVFGNDGPTYVVGEAALITCSYLLGALQHSRDQYRAEMLQRARLAEAQLDREAEQRVIEERLRIARELHDVMAHTITAISVQAGSGADVFEERPDQARSALEAIRGLSREAMSELRATIGPLRSGGGEEPGLLQAPGLGDLDNLIDTVQRAGIAVELVRDGDAAPLPASVDLTAFRVVQESLTNVVRHAGARRASVVIRRRPGAVTVEVRDDGRGPNGRVPPGHGITGMAERVHALGGTFSAGGAPGGGFQVVAIIPTDAA